MAKSCNVMKIIFYQGIILLIYLIIFDRQYMNELSKKSLIKIAEESYEHFMSILATLTQEIPGQSEFQENNLKAFFNLQTAIEEDVFEMRLKKIIDRENPYIPAIRTTNLPGTEKYDHQALQELIGLYLEQKKEVIKFLYNVPAFYWNRSGFHELEGHVTFEEFIKRMINNDKKNLQNLLAHKKQSEPADQKSDHT